MFIKKLSKRSSSPIHYLSFFLLLSLYCYPGFPLALAHQIDSAVDSELSPASENPIIAHNTADTAATNLPRQGANSDDTKKCAPNDSECEKSVSEADLDDIIRKAFTTLKDNQYHSENLALHSEQSRHSESKLEIENNGQLENVQKKLIEMEEKLLKTRPNIIRWASIFTKELVSSRELAMVGLMKFAGFLYDNDYLARVGFKGKTKKNPPATKNDDDETIQNQAAQISENNSFLQREREVALIANGMFVGIAAGIKAFTSGRIKSAEAMEMIYKIRVKETAELVSAMPKQKADLINDLDQTTAIQYQNNWKLFSTWSFYNSGDNGNSEWLSNLFKSSLALRELLLIPFADKPKRVFLKPTPGMSNEELKMATQTEAKIRTLLEDYPESKHSLNNIIRRIANNSDPEQEAPRRAQAYLWGKAGTGKTSFAKRLADAAGLGLCKIDRNELTLEGLLGKPPMHDYYNKYHQLKDFKSIVGKLGECYRKFGHNNFIVLIDELGDIIGETLTGEKSKAQQSAQAAFAGWAKDFFEAENKTLNFGYPGLEADFSRITIIGTGNSKIQKGQQPLATRFPSIEFKDLSVSQKALALAQQYNIELQARANKDPQGTELLDEATRPFLSFILQQDLKRFEGGRVIKAVVSDTVGFISDVLENNLGLSEDQVRMFIVNQLDGALNTTESS